MEVEVICFNLARLTGVVYCGSLLLLMASNSSNGAHLLSFHPPSLHWWVWPNTKKFKKYHLFVWNIGEALLFGFRENWCAPWLYACACTWDKRSVWCLNLILDYPAFVCALRVRVFVRVAEPRRSANVGPRRRPLSAINLGNQTKRAEKEKFSS